MASLTKDNGPKSWRIQFMGVIDKQSRKTIRLSGLTRKQAEQVLGHVENIIGCRLQQTRLDDPDATWLGSLPDKFHEKLVKAELVEQREKAQLQQEGVSLRDFLAEFIEDGRTLKGHPASVETSKKWRGTRDMLLQCFDGERLVSSFSLVDGKAFRKWMEQREVPVTKRNPTARMAENSMRQRIANCKTFFSYAVKEEFVASNPFRNQVSNTQDNTNGKLRISAEIIDTVIAAAPDAEWRLLIALWRYAGLRKMEPLHLEWNDVFWDEGMIRVKSPKTQHHRRKRTRNVPIRDIERYLKDVFTQRNPADSRIFARYSPTMSNLHKPFEDIIEAAKIKPWPNLIKNLRLSCENDWLDNKEAPAHVIAAWIGHSVEVQNSDYAMVSEGHFEQFNARPAKSKNVSHSVSDDVRNGQKQQEMSESPVRGCVEKTRKPNEKPDKPPRSRTPLRSRWWRRPIPQTSRLAKQRS